MGTAIEYRNHNSRAKTATLPRTTEGEPPSRRLIYVRSWNRAVETRKPRHRRSNRWWW